MFNFVWFFYVILRLQKLCQFATGHSYKSVLNEIFIKKIYKDFIFRILNCIVCYNLLLIKIKHRLEKLLMKH